MQTKIHNPYQAQLDAGKVPQYLLISFSNLSIGFDEGVEAARAEQSKAIELLEFTKDPEYQKMFKETFERYLITGELRTKARIVAKSFADELPEEGQRIFAMLKNGSAECCLFFSSCLSGYEYEEQGVFYTHWLPYPKLT